MTPFFASILLAATATVACGDAAPAAKPVDLAICLDTSGSMNGLIDSARQKIWSIVNDLALARPTPRLRVALLTFGNDGHRAEAGWVNVDCPFTEDLDLVSQRLFALTTNGGTEYVGRVVRVAVDQLDWSSGSGALKILVVAGNESADQDPEVPFRDASRLAISRDVVVNSIYCGNGADNLAPAWREVATLADGRFASIDQNGTVAVPSPFDADIAKLGTDLNGTYLANGKAGLEGCSNQTVQDQNAASLNTAAAAGRAASKASALYRCSWDLVDACRDEAFDLATVKEEDLPEEMRKMTLGERKAHVEKKRLEREAIQMKIADLAAKRNAFVAEEMKKSANEGDRAFDLAVRSAIRAQAEAKGFRFEAEAAVVSSTEESRTGSR